MINLRKNVVGLILQQPRPSRDGILNDAYPSGGNVKRPAVTYREIYHLITQDFIESHNKQLSIIALQSFVKIRAKRAIRGEKLAFFYIPKGKECLLIRFFEDKGKLPVAPIYDSVPTAPILMEPSVMAFNV